MDYFRKYLGGQPGGVAPSGAETVEKLCDRVQSSTLLEDRRDAVRALKSLSKKFRLEVGSQALNVLLGVLHNDRSDSEIIGFALDALCNVMSNEPPEDEEDMPLSPVPDDLGIQFTEMFIKMPDNISLLLSLLEEYDFHVRWPTVKLLTTLLFNKSRDLQEAILVSPQGVSKLMDLLSDSREIIRNDGLLLLIQLTRSNANIQKIVAFENAFERLLDIVSEEGNSDGGIVVEDCLLLLLNLMKNNSSNQNFFKEGSYVQRLPPFFELQEIDQSPQGGWSAQKVTNIHLMLQIVRCLVSPNTPAQQMTACQKIMMASGLLQQLCNILMASGVPADVLTETINTVSEVIRGNSANQEFFASVMAPSNPPRPAIVVLLMSMVNEKQPFTLRCAVLYCFQSFLYKNDLGQSQIISTLLPTTADANSVSAGQLLCGGLFSGDSLSAWFAATALLHSITSNMAQKEQLLRVQLATSLGNPPVSLLQQCTNILAQGGRVQTRIGLLMLMCTWLAQCPIAVTHFLHNSANVPYLISQVSSSEADEQELLVQGLCAFLLGVCVCFNEEQVENYQSQHMRQIIEKRIGVERFTDKLLQVSKHEGYTRAAKQPQLLYKASSEILFDFEFTKLFRKFENEVLKAVSPVDESEAGRQRPTLDQHDNIVDQYKELIREQDQHLNSVKAELSVLQTEHSQAEKELEEMKNQIQQLKDQNSLLKAHRGLSSNSSGDISEAGKLQEIIDEKAAELEGKNKQIERLKEDLAAKPAVSAESGNQGGGDLNSHDQGEIADLKKKIEQKDEEVKLYKSKYENATKQVTEVTKKLSDGKDEPDSTSSALLAERNSMSEKISQLEGKICTLEHEKAAVEVELEALKLQHKKTQEKVQSLENEVSDRLSSLEEHENIKKEQEDLLVLLADQDTKLKTYRKQVKELGGKVEDDEDDDDDDDDFDEDENGLDED